MSDVAAKRIFVTSLGFLFAVLSFGYGLAVERFQVWPYQSIHAAWTAARSFLEYGEVIPPGRRVAARDGASRDRFTIHDPSSLNDGYYVFVGWDDDSGLYGAWLYDQTGSRRHTWLFDYYALDPDGPWNGEDHPHPFYALSDGSVLVAFDSGDLMVRLDACSEPVWKKSGIYHHSMSRAEDGSFWIWRGEGTPYGHYHYIENFDVDTGETIQEIALVEDVISKSLEPATIFGVRPDYSFRHFERDPIFRAAMDIFHPNDVEPLSSEIAEAFPDFEVGDLLISIRNMDLVAVVDPEDAALRWWSHGPWIAQHDPDFLADGTISVFNNNPGRGRSEIVKIDPSTRQVTNALAEGEASFYTTTMGKHQYLPNGNVLIAVPDEGRAIEVTADGANVMEFNNVAPNPPSYNDHIENAMWLPESYFTEFPACLE